MNASVIMSILANIAVIAVLFVISWSFHVSALLVFSVYGLVMIAGLKP